jgi:hypothetical protein
MQPTKERGQIMWKQKIIQNRKPNKKKPEDKPD